MTTLQETIDIAETLYQRLKASSNGKQVDNVTNHLIALIESHGFTDKTQSSMPFWDSLVNDKSFFEKAKMPKKWGSDSSYGHGMESMMKIMQEPKVKEALVTAWTETGYKKGLEECDKHRKSFLKNYKKVRRDVESESVKPEELTGNEENESITMEDIEEASPVPSEVGDVTKLIPKKKQRKTVVVLEQPIEQASSTEVNLKAELARIRDHVEYTKKLVERCMRVDNKEVTMFGLETIMAELSRI